jgi:hypothetical protein
LEPLAPGGVLDDAWEPIRHLAANWLSSWSVGRWPMARQVPSAARPGRPHR